MKFLVLALFFGLAAAHTGVEPLSKLTVFSHFFKNFNFKEFGYGSYFPETPACSSEYCHRSAPSHSYFPYSPATPYYRYVKYGVYSTRDLYESPLIVLVKDTDTTLAAYYVEKGFRSLPEYPSYAPLNNYFRSPIEKYGLVFYPKHFFNAHLFNMPITKYYIPEHFKVSEFSRMVSNWNDIPIFFVQDKAGFEHFNFESLTEMARFGVYSDFIEPIIEPVTPILFKTSHA